MATGRLRNMTIGINVSSGNSISRLDQLNNKTNTFHQRIQQINKGLMDFGKWGITRLTLPLVALGGLLTNTASQAEEMQAKFDTVFGDLAQSTQTWAEDTAKAVGRSRIDLQTYLADLQNTNVGMGMARAEAAEFSKEILMLGIDLASFNNLAESDALNSLQSALVGNHMAARSLGAILNENTLALAMQDMGLQGTFQQLDENRKMQVRFRAVVMQSEDSIGDAVRTSGSFANQMRALKGEVKDLSAELGKELLPYATELVSVFRDAVGWLRDLNPETKNLAINIASLAAIIPIAAYVFGWLWKIGTWIWKIGGWIWGAGLAVSKFLGWGIGGAVVILFNVIMVIDDLIGYLKTGESTIVDFVKTALHGFGIWWDNLKTVWNWIKTEPAKIFENSLNSIDSIFMGWIGGFGTRFKEGFSGALQGLRDLLPFSPVKDPTSPLYNLQKAGIGIVSNIREGMADAASRVNFNAPVAATAGPVMRGGGSYSFSPHVEINVHGGGDSKQTAQMTKAEVERMFPRLMDDFFRRAARQS